MNEAQFINVSPLNRNSRFNAVAQEVVALSLWLVGQLKHGPKGGLHFMKLKCQNCLGITKKKVSIGLEKLEWNVKMVF